MKKNIIGWTLLILISILPIILLFVFGPASNNLFTFSEFTQKLGEISALVGMTLFALTFILSARLKFVEDMFGGLDKVYAAHCFTGGLAFSLILFHPILLVLKFIPSNMTLAAKYLLPGSFWSVNFGIIALLSMFVLLYFTFYTKIKYHKWKFSHKFLGLIFIIAVFHVMLVRGTASRDFIFHGYYYYIVSVSIIGIASFFYTLFLKKRITKEAIYKVVEVNSKKELNEFVFASVGKPLEYRSGQFIFVRFYNENLSSESHPFSIASKTNDPNIKIVVKNLGDFTSRLNNIKIGDKVALEGPYGRFHCVGDGVSNEVWIAGGIGITPFIGLAEEIKDKNIGHKIDLYYSVKTKDELIAADNFKDIEKHNKNFRFFPWITTESGYITLDKIIERSGDIKDSEIYICGPPAFKKSLKETMINMGIKENKICDEDFNFR